MRVLISIGIAAAAACGSMTPVGPSPGAELSITPGSDALYVSEQVHFFVTSGVQSTAARWSSSDTSVIDVDSTGLVVARATGRALLTVSVASETASRALRVVPDYRGRFSGVMRLTRCERVSGAGPNGTCQVGARYRISLFLEQQAGAVMTGTLDVFNEPTIGAITGEVDESLHIGNVAATLKSAGESHIVTIIERWDTWLTDSGATMVGSFSADSQFSNGFGPQHQKEEYELVSVLRQ